MVRCELKVSLHEQEDTVSSLESPGFKARCLSSAFFSARPPQKGSPARGQGGWEMTDNSLGGGKG